MFCPRRISISEKFIKSIKFIKKMARPIDIFEKIKGKIRHIQSSPEKEKNRIVWVLAIIIFALIIALWLRFAEEFRVKSEVKNDSYAKIISDFKSNIENKIKQFPVWKSEK